MQPEHPELRLTYAQIGARLGISAEAARTLTRRRGWRRITPNRKGAPVTVVLTAEDLEGEQWRTEEERTCPSKEADTPELGADTPELEADNPGLRLEQAERRADEANARADAAITLADRLSTQLADAVTRGDRANDRADRLERDLTDLQLANDARKGRGRLARLKAAWRGE